MSRMNHQRLDNNFAVSNTQFDDSFVIVPGQIQKNLSNFFSLSNTQSDDSFVILLGHIRKPLFDFLTEFDAKNLQLANKEIAGEVEIHRKRWGFPQAAFKIHPDGQWTIRYKGRIHDVSRHDEISWGKMTPTAFGSRIIPPRAPYAIYGGDSFGSGIILYIDNKVDVKDIIMSYKLELRRMDEVSALQEKRLKKEEDRKKWEKTHIFPMKGNTAPTNPWKKLLKPGCTDQVAESVAVCGAV